MNKLKDSRKCCSLDSRLDTSTPPPPLVTSTLFTQPPDTSCDKPKCDVVCQAIGCHNNPKGVCLDGCTDIQCCCCKQPHNVLHVNDLPS